MDAANNPRDADPVFAPHPMRLALHQPAFPLSGFVELFTFYEGYNPAHSIERLLPEGVVEVIIDLREAPQFIYDNVTLGEIQSCRRAWVSGMRTRFLSIGVTRESAMFIIRFRPGKAWPFLRIPLHEIDNQVVDANAIFGRDLPFFREALADCPTSAGKFALAESFLLRLARHQPELPPAIDYAIRQLVQHPGTARINTLAQQIGYSQKHFIHLFQTYAGLTPKQFGRILKFQETVRAIETRQAPQWAQLAVDCGYYDQAHFINEFKAFSGYTPTDYLLVKGEIVNYIPVR